MDEEESQALKAAEQPPPDPEEQVVAAPASRKTTLTWVWRMSSAMVVSFFLVVLFTITLVYSQGIDPISSFASTTFERTFSTTNQVPPYPYKPESTMTCNSTTTPMITTCPSNYPPQTSSPPSQRNASTQSTCPEYFRWIHEDLKPWKKQGITKDMLEEISGIRKYRHFRLIIVNGTAYVKCYEKAWQNRDTLTLWGVLQLLKRYPGKLPDLDLIFQCHDQPSIRKDAYEEGKAPPLFHFCGSDDTHDIVFPDWSYWGWPEVNIKPWASVKKDMAGGNKLKKWADREPYAFWKGSFLTKDRNKLRNCNSTTDWNALIYEQNWRKEIEDGFKNSDMTKQCTQKYKVYIEGKAWSVSQKYILACDAMTLLVDPFYYEFFSRGLVPMKHYWPIPPHDLCKSIKSAVDWGNKNPKKAEEIGREGSKFIQDELTMQYVYDYMFHLLSEYSKLLTYKPTVLPGAVELCSDFWVCARNDLERTYKVETNEMGPATDEPCTLLGPFSDSEVDAHKEKAAKGFMQVQAWELTGKFNG